MLRHALLFVATLYAAPVAAQSVPDDLNQFGLICFCNSRVATPHMPIALDNNGRLLFAARNGTSRDAIRNADITFSDSQLRMLEDWGLLTEKGKVLKTAFPILDPASMAQLRTRLKQTEMKLLPGLRAEARMIKSELARRGRAESTYAALFSYVLDGLVWGRLATTGKMPNTDITIERPYWAGTFWAVYPKQDDMPGTNGQSDGRAALKMLWNPAVVKQINAFYGSPPTEDWLRSANSGGPDPQSPFGPKSMLVVREDHKDPIYQAGSKMADQIAAAVEGIDLSEALPEADESQRVLIGTHELIWQILADLTASESIDVPDVLKRDASGPADLAPLVVGVIGAPKADKP